MFGAATPGADRAVGLDLHRAAAHRALPGRRRGPRCAGASTCRPRTSRASACARRRPGARRTRTRPLRARARVRGARARSELLGRGRAADRRAARRARGSRSPRSSPAGARRSTRSSAPATTCSPGRRAPARRARRALALAGDAASSTRRHARVSTPERDRSEAYARCEAITRTQAANFYYGIRLLAARAAPGDVRGVRVRAARRRHRRRRARAARRSCACSTPRPSALARARAPRAALHAQDGSGDGRAGRRAARASRCPPTRSRS